MRKPMIGGGFGGRGMHGGRVTRGGRGMRGGMLGGRGLVGGWGKSSVRKMKKVLSHKKRIYENEELNSMKNEKFDNPQTFIAEFIQKLNATGRAVKKMASLKQSKIVKVKNVRQQVVAGMKYKIDVHLENKKKLTVEIFVPLPYTKKNPIISSVKRAGRNGRGMSRAKGMRGMMIGGRGMAGGWRRSSVRKMKKTLSRTERVYKNEELNAMKTETFDVPETFIAEFILKLNVAKRRATKKMASLRQSKIVKVKNVRKQVVAGMKYKVDVHLENKKRFTVEIFVPLPHTKKDPIIQSVKRAGRRYRL